MDECALVGSGLTNDAIFDPNSEGNRDGCYEPYCLLAKHLERIGLAIHTPDRLTSNPVFEIHLNVQRHQGSGPSYLLLMETPTVYPPNGEIPERYNKIFTWNDSLVDNSRFIKINFPNPKSDSRINEFAARDLFCCMIAGNKSARRNDPSELYSTRVEVIRWFEANASKDFHLYGVDWDLPPARNDYLWKLEKRVRRHFNHRIQSRPFPSYRGSVPRKSEVLERTLFSICYENVRDLPGYITEKIFDCFLSGCVPVYLGASNIESHIPSSCFIDRRKFADNRTLYRYLKSIDEIAYRSFQKEIAGFLNSRDAQPFFAEAFAQTIVSAIGDDLHRI